MDEDIPKTRQVEVKIFPEPSKEDLEEFMNRKKQMMEIIVFSTGALIAFIMLVFGFVAFFMVKNYALGNIGILIVLLTIAIFLTRKFFKVVKSDFETRVARIVDVKNISKSFNSYEDMTKEEAENQVKLQVHFQFTNHVNDLQQGSFNLIFTKDKLPKIEAELPKIGDEIHIIYDKKKKAVGNIFLPSLKEYMGEIL